MDTLGRLLQPHETLFTDQRHRTLTRTLLQWSLDHCSCGRPAAWHARLVFIAATFEVCVSPDDAPFEDSLLAAQYSALFFGLDDGTDEELHSFRRYLGSGIGGGESGALTGTWLEGLRSRTRDTSRLETSLRELGDALAEERATDPDTLDAEQFHRLRLTSAGVFPYLWCRRTFRSLVFLSDEQNRTADLLSDLTAEVVYLANDLASTVKESAEEHGVLNSVLFHARHSGDLGASLEAVTGRYHQRVTELRNGIETIDDPDGPFAGTRLPELGPVLHQLADGNLDGHSRLASTRYPKADELLQGLPRAGGPRHTKTLRGLTDA